MKKIIKAVLIIMVTISLMTGCTPKSNKIWVQNNEVKFSVEYSAYDIVFDGLRSSFSVKDKNDFEKMLEGLPSYLSEIDLMDADVKAKIFKTENELFYIYNSEKNKYVLSPALLVIFHSNGTESKIVAPPMGKFQYGETDSINSKREWQYFIDFYSLIDAEIDNVQQKISITKNGLNYSIILTDGKFNIEF